MAEKLTLQENLRYSRQMLIWDKKGQEKLKSSTIFIAGAGGLGGPAAIYLACAGIGKLRICDFDVIEVTNLNRQILHDDSKLEKNKAESAKETLNRLNKNVEVVPIKEKIDEKNVANLVGESDIVIDCLDNFETRFILNKFCVSKKKPFVFGAVYGFEGQVSFIQHPETFCLACMFEGAPEKEVFPVVGTTPGVIGTLQAMEAIKFLTKTGENLKNLLLTWDGLKQEFRKVQVGKDPDCEVCGKKK